MRNGENDPTGRFLRFYLNDDPTSIMLHPGNACIPCRLGANDISVPWRRRDTLATRHTLATHSAVLTGLSSHFPAPSFLPR